MVLPVRADVSFLVREEGASRHSDWKETCGDRLRVSRCCLDGQQLCSPVLLEEFGAEEGDLLLDGELEGAVGGEEGGDGESA